MEAVEDFLAEELDELIVEGAVSAFDGGEQGAFFECHVEVIQRLVGVVFGVVFVEGDKACTS